MNLSELEPGHIYATLYSKAIWSKKNKVVDSDVLKWISSGTEFLALRKAEKTNKAEVFCILVLGIHDEFLGYIRSWHDHDIFEEVLPES